MRVLVLSNLYPPNAMGGYEMSCRDVVDRWRARDHDVTVLTTATTLAGVVEPPQAQPHVRRELDWYWSEHAFLRPPVLQRWALERRNHRALRRALDDARPDVVSVWHMGGMSLSLLTVVQRTGVPVVLNVCDEWPVYGPRVDAWLDAWSHSHAPARRLGELLSGVPTDLPDLDRCRASYVSAFTLERVRDRSRWAFPNSTVVGSGVDADDFPLVGAAEERPWRGELLAVGRIEPRKGFDTALRALALLPAARLRLVGVPDPAHLRDLLRLADEQDVGHRLRVEALPRAELRHAYRQADALLFTPRWEEPFGLVPLEAMTQRTPVVATRRGGSAEFLVDGRNCLEVPTDDAAAVAAQVQRLAGSAELRTALADGGARTAARYGADRLADVLEQLHREAAAPRTAPVLEDVASRSWATASPALSVVVATHDRQPFLDDLLTALERQISPPGGLEVVLADDGSTDGTWKHLRSRVQVSPLPVLALRLPATGGPSIPRNTAASRSRGPALALTDDDCLPEPRWAAALVDALASGVGIVQGRTVPHAEGASGPWDRTITVRAPTGLYETCNLGIGAALFTELGGFPDAGLADRGFGEDVLLGAAAARAGGAAWAPRAVVQHRWLPDDYRGHLRSRRRLTGFPHLAKEVPELRTHLWQGCALSRRTAAADAALAGLLLAVGLRRVLPLAAAAPWLRTALPDARRRPGRPLAVRLAQLALADLVGAVSLVEGSLRARRLLL